MKNSILVTGTNNITGINIIKALLVNDKNIIYGCDYNEINVANKFCQNFVVSKSNHSTYIKEIIDIIEKYNVKYIIPSNDHELRVLSENINQLLSKGIYLNGFSTHTINFLNKVETTYIFNKNNILTPKRYNKNNIEFPLVVRKNEMGNGKKFVHIVNSNSEFELLPKDEIETAILTQYVGGNEFTIDVVCDLDSNVYSVVPRLRREVIGGMVSFAEIVKNENVISATKELASKLKLTGINCVQCIVKDKECYFIEVNPRPGSGMDLTTNSGVNMPQMWLDLLNKKHVTDLEPNWGLKMLRYYDGYYFK